MECKFVVEQQVVALTTFNSHPDIVPNTPQKGHVYTIRHIGSYSRGIGLMFIELTNPIVNSTHDGIGEVAFTHEHFAPLIEQKKTTDISIFRTILDDASQKREPALYIDGKKVDTDFRVSHDGLRRG